MQQPFWERVVGALGLLLTLFLLGYLLFQQLTSESTLPDIQVQVTEIWPNGEDFLVVVKASNSGGRTAATVVIEGEILLNGKVLEKSELTIAYIPAKSTREAGLFFSRNPAELPLNVRALGYTQP